MIEMTERVITDDLQALIGCLPPEIAKAINGMEDQGDLLEIVIDLGPRAVRPIPRR